MARNRFTAPTLKLGITPEAWEEAKEADSGGCIIADRIKKQYPHLTNISVDMATIRASDREKGLRYWWLTSDPAQMLLLSYDQGWGRPLDELTITGAVKVVKITQSKKDRAKAEAKLVRLEAKIAAGEELTNGEKITLGTLRKSLKRRRPSATGPAEIGSKGVVHGGREGPRKKLPTNPNLLRGRNRLYGAKTAQPARVFAEAVEIAAEERAQEIAQALVTESR